MHISTRPDFELLELDPEMRREIQCQRQNVKGTTISNYSLCLVSLKTVE